MSGTVLEHRLVQDYLDSLAYTMRGVPAGQYRELRDQIIAHLDDELPADADDAQVAAALRRLGAPAALAAEAKAGIGPTIPALLAAAAHRTWARITGARWRTKILAGLTVLVVATGATYLVDILSAPLIEFGGSGVFWYPQDANHEVSARADGAQQVTVPVRSGHWQGLLFDIYNPSNFTETVIGPVPYDFPDQAFGSFDMGVSLPDREIDNYGGTIRDVGFTLPESIPPHQFRLLRLTWISAMCLEGKGSGFLIDRLRLRVRIGWFTRTDVIALGMGWGLTGPSHNPDTRPGPNYNRCL